MATEKSALLRLLRAARRGESDTLLELIGSPQFMSQLPAGALLHAMNAAAVKGQHVSVAGILATSPWILNEQDERKQVRYSFLCALFVCRAGKARKGAQ
jgi:hypothetical protein